MSLEAEYLVRNSYSALIWPGLLMTPLSLGFANRFPASNSATPWADQTSQTFSVPCSWSKANQLCSGIGISCLALISAEPPFAVVEGNNTLKVGTPLELSGPSLRIIKVPWLWAGKD